LVHGEVVVGVFVDGLFVLVYCLGGFGHFAVGWVAENGLLEPETGLFKSLEELASFVHIHLQVGPHDPLLHIVH